MWCLAVPPVVALIILRRMKITHISSAQIAVENILAAKKNSWNIIKRKSKRQKNDYKQLSKKNCKKNFLKHLRKDE